MKFIAFASALVLGLTTTVFAYPKISQITVTKKARNFYHDVRSELIVRTKNCYTFAHRRDAILQRDGRKAFLVFLDYKGLEKTRCEVKAVYHEISLK